MKVLHLSSEKTWRGGEQQIAYLIEELRNSGVECFAAVRKDSEFERWCQQKSVEYISLNFANDFDLRSAWSLKNYCRKNKFDILHLHTSRAHGIAYLSAILGNSVPMVLSRRVDFPLKNDFLSRAKYNYRGIRKILCVSDNIRKIVSKSINHPEKCITVHSGIDQNRFATLGKKGSFRKKYSIDNSEILIGNVAALAPHKDHLTFLKTASILATRYPVKFVIAGEGEMRKTIEEEIKHLNLQDKVIMTGFVRNIEEIYNDLDLLLFTSSQEGLGTSLLDAMACGVPVISTDAGGIPEVVINDQTGLTAPVMDADGLAKQVMRVIEDRNLKERLIAGAKNHLKNFFKQTTASKTLTIYLECLDN